MKTVLILLIIVFCVLGFLFFIWYISKKDTHNPIEELKKNDEREAAFIKQRQQMYHQQEKTEVKKIEILKSEDRGKLFERAIERKRSAYKDDDEEYQNRLQGLKGEEKQEEVSPIQPMGMPEPEEEPVPTTPITMNEDTPEPEKEEKTNIDWNDWEEQKQPLRPSPLQQQSDFQKRKEEVEKKEKERKMDIQTLRAEILSEVENLKKRRLAFIEIPN